MVNPLSTAERLSIDSERQAIMEELKTGDLDNLRSACYRLSALAENHYTANLLAPSITLIAGANGLIDQVRARTITTESQRAESGQIIQGVVEILNQMRQAEPAGRIPGGNANMDPEISRVLRSLSEPKAAESERSEALEDDDAAERELLNVIVRATDPQTKGTLIVAEDIGKNYSNTNFKLQQINLSLHRGDILGVVGVNASGKTTLLRILMGDLKPSNGVLRYPTIEQGTEKRNWKQIKRRIAYVSQTLPWWPGRVFDNLRYVASLYGHPQRSIDLFLDKLLQRYGLDKFKNATWSEISGGYRTRFEIVRALVSNPDILLLDEPLAYLDILSQQVVLRQLRQLARSRARPMGIVITSQQLYEIEAIADRLLVLDGGNTLFSGPVSDLTNLIDELVVEFRSTGAPLSQIKSSLLSRTSGRILISSETGYIAMFDNAKDRSTNEEGLDFNGVVEFLGKQCPGKLSYARNISSSCRVLLEPRLANYLRERGNNN